MSAKKKILPVPSLVLTLPFHKYISFLLEQSEISHFNQSLLQSKFWFELLLTKSTPEDWQYGVLILTF